MNRFVTIASYIDLPLAELAKARLEAEGLYCHLLGNNHVGVNWLYSNALGGVRVQVLREDEERAKAILQRDDSAALEGLERGDAEPELVCEKCGSSDLELVRASRKAGALSLLFNLPLLFFRRRWRCRNCGHTMKIKGIST